MEKAKKEEAVSRLKMFEQVLEIDENDLIANFGMGKALLDSGRAEEAVKYLKKCIDVKKDYSAAYLQLGKAYIKANNQAQAEKIFKAGIERATENGDLMPKNEMERHLEDIRRNPE